MKVRTVYWSDKDRMKIKESFTDIRSAYFKTAGRAYWKLLLAAQEVEITKGQVTVIKVKPIRLPPKTAVSPLSIMRHALGSVVDVYFEKMSRIEEEKRIVNVAFLPIQDGKVEEGDLVGVVKVYPMNVAPADSIGSIGEPDVNVTLEEAEGNIVYWKDGVVRERVRMKEYWYRRWNIAEWHPIIARESAHVHKGEINLIRVENLELPENTIPVPLSMMRHAMGSVVDVAQAGKPRLVEEKKLITHAVFVPAFDGTIERGDLLGVLNVYYISTGERSLRLLQQLIKREEANLVYWDEGVTKRRAIHITPFSFKRSSIGRFEPLVAAESIELERGDVELVKIADLEFPSGTIVQPLAGFSHAVGSVLDVAALEPPKMVEDDRRATHAVVIAAKKGRIDKGDLLGAVAIYNVSVLREPEFFLSRYQEIFTKQ